MVCDPSMEIFAQHAACATGASAGAQGEEHGSSR